MALYYDYEFEGPVAYHDVGSDRYQYTVVYLPEELIHVLPLDEFPRLRITGEVNDFPFEASLTPVRGAWYILFSKKTLKAINVSVGDAVNVRFGVADQNAVDVPDALQTALNKNKKMSSLWDTLTAGKQRALSHRVASAKTPPTQAKRIAEVFDIMKGKRDMRGKLIN